MTKNEFAKAVLEKGNDYGLAAKHMENIITNVFDVIVEELVATNKMTITGFGTFHLDEKAARKARNPRTGESIEVPPKMKLSFKATRVLQERLNDECIGDE